MTGFFVGLVADIVLIKIFQPLKPWLVSATVGYVKVVEPGVVVGD